MVHFLFLELSVVVIFTENLVKINHWFDNFEHKLVVKQRVVLKVERKIDMRSGL